MLEKSGFAQKLKYMDRWLIIAVAALNIIGLLAIGSADRSLMPRQLVGMLLGLVMMVVIAAGNYGKILEFWRFFYVLNLVLLIAVLLIGTTVGGAQRWISIGGFSFQPSEAAKILLILFFAQFITLYREKLKSWQLLLISLVLALIPVVMILKEPDLSTSIMVMVIVAVMLFVGGISYKIVIGVLGVSVPAVLIFLMMVLRSGQHLLNDYQRNRILAWLHPEDYADTTAYQTMNSIMAIGSGGLIGKGYNTGKVSSLLNTGFISESETDFIFAVIGEELGFIGCCIVVALIVAIALRCFVIASRTQSLAGKLVASGMGAWVGFQGFLNIGVATGVVPNTGIPLPFVSYGLTSLVCLYIGIGFVLNVRVRDNLTSQ